MIWRHYVYTLQSSLKAIRRKREFTCVSYLGYSKIIYDQQLCPLAEKSLTIIMYWDYFHLDLIICLY